IPEEMQKKYGFPALGGANSATKQMIFGSNAARLYGVKLKAAENTRMPAYSEDRLTKLKGEYELAAREPTNLRYGYVRAGGTTPIERVRAILMPPHDSAARSGDALDQWRVPGDIPIYQPTKSGRASTLVAYVSFEPGQTKAFDNISPLPLARE